MSTGTRHTAKAFDDDMDHIRGLIAEMGARAETAVTNAMKALIGYDKELAQITRADDKIIDRLETADDLRDLVAALKIAAVIERIGDYAKNISKRVGQLETNNFLSSNDQLRLMGDIAGEMVRNTMDAYARRDIELARAVTIRDDAVNQLYKNLFVDFIGFVAKNPQSATEIAHLLYISKNLERIGDHATNWAHMIYFTETGDNLPEE
jgi:phosphate transport system protein